MSVTPIVTTPTTAKAWSPDLNAFAPVDVISQALVLQTSTVLGNIQGDEPVLRVAYVDTDQAATFVAEGELIPPQAPALAEVAVPTGKVAVLVPMSNEQFHQPGAAQAMADAVSAAVTAKADEAYLAQPAPTGSKIGPAAGLLNIDGVTDAGSVSGNLDALVDAVATSEANGGHPSHIILDPMGWAALAKIKAEAGGAVSLLGAGTTAADRLLLGLPVIVSRYMPRMSGLVIDKTAVVSAVSQVQVAQSDQVYFAQDATALRCTFRFGQAVVHPERIARFTISGKGGVAAAQ